MKFHLPTLLVCVMVLASSSAGSSQAADSTEYKQFVRVLPFIMKSINANQQSNANKAERVHESEFVAPWNLAPFDQSEIDVFIGKLKSESTFEIKEARGDYLNLNIYSTLQNFREEPKLKKEFNNIFIEISNFNIVNENNEEIYLADKVNMLQPKQGGKQKVTMQGAQFNTLIPISKDHTTISGSIDLAIKQKSEFVYKEFSKDDAPTTSDLNGVPVDLIQLNGNQAIFRSATKIENLKIISVNGEDKKHNQSSYTQLPEKIYLKAKEDNLTEEEITEFVKAYSMEDFNNKQNLPTMIIFESSGDIGKVYLYQVVKEEERGKCMLNIKL